MDYDIYRYFISFAYKKEPNSPIEFGNFFYDSLTRIMSADIIEAIESELKMDRAYSSVSIISYQQVFTEKL